MALGVADTIYTVAGVALFVMGAWLLYLSPRQRAVRALSALLMLTAIAFGDNALREYLPLAGVVWIDRLDTLVFAGIGLSTIYFLSVYPRSRGWLGRSRWGGPSVLGAFALLGLAILLFPRLVGDPRIVGDEIAVDPPPLGFLYSAWSLTGGLMLILLALDYRRAQAGPFRRSLLLVLTGFLAGSLAWQTSLLLNDVFGRLDPFVFRDGRARLAYLLDEIVIIPALVAALLVLVHGLRAGEREARHEAIGLGMAAGIAVTASLIATFAFPGPVGTEWTSEPQGAVDALGALALAVFAGYAVLKHRLFDIEVKLRWTISRGTVAAVFLAIFVTAAQIAQNFLSESQGWLTGGIIAGAMLFAITPIQRLAERVAITAVPVHAKPAEERRLELYRLALGLALCDRVITREEEQHLARLAEELGLTHSEALTARHEMEREMGSAAQ